jgi:succinoglycan biosynthesis protein ExoL
MVAKVDLMVRPAHPRVAYFGHNIADAAVQRRCGALIEVGCDLTSYTMRRTEPRTTPWPNVDLGRTADKDFRQRLVAIGRGLTQTARHSQALRSADIWIARNLDMLIVAGAAHTAIGARGRLIYECLDIHAKLHGDGVEARMLRGVERALLKRCAGLIVSSPGFMREYFDLRHPGLAKVYLLENRLAHGLKLPPRPSAESPRSATGPLQIGWFGVLRCPRSLPLLRAAAAKARGKLEATLRGTVSRPDLPSFDADVTDQPNLSYRGPYRFPDDLAQIYGGIDLIWAGDFHDPGANSRWLLPNRLYEGGYFGAVPVAPKDSETGRWLETHALGFTLPEPLEQTLPAFLQAITPAEIAAARAKLLAAPTSLFVQPADEVRDFVDAVLAAPAR